MRKQFNLREIGQSLIRYAVGDGCNIAIWVDNWHPLGPLCKNFWEEVVRNLGISLRAKVSTTVSSGD